MTTRAAFLAFVESLPPLPTTLMACAHAPKPTIQRQVRLFTGGRWTRKAIVTAVDDGQRWRLYLT